LVLVSQAARILASDLLDLLGCQLAASAFFSVVRHVRVPSLFHHILRVVVLGPLKKMLRVHAGWGVTTMKDAETICDCSKVNEERYSVRSLRPAMKIEHPVPVIVSFSSPQPAIVIAALDDTGPESVNFVSPPHLAHLEHVLTPSRFALSSSGRTTFTSHDCSRLRDLIHVGIIPKR
jgi:hypothetical protein